MISIRLLAPVAGALALAACGEPAPAPTKATATPTPAPTAQPLTALPEAFRGKWATSADQCGSGSGRATVAATELTFPDSRATVSDIVQTRPGRVTATLHYRNRMGKWDSPTTMTLRNDDKTLVRDDTHPTGRFTYERCAG